MSNKDVLSMKECGCKILASDEILPCRACWIEEIKSNNLNLSKEKLNKLAKI